MGKLWDKFIHSPLAVLIGMSMVLRLIMESLLLVTLVVLYPGLAIPPLLEPYSISLPVYVWMLLGGAVEYSLAKFFMSGWKQ